VRLLSTASCTSVAVALLAGCSGNMSQPGTSGPSTAAQTQSQFDSHGKFIPHWAYPASVIPKGQIGIRGQALKTRFAPDAKKRAAEGGIYGSQYLASIINGYPHKNTSNGPPTCSLPGGSYVNGIAVDGKGNLIDPDGGGRTIVVYAGPGMCGSEVGSISDPYGQPSDASSANAATGEIAVGMVFDTSGEGGIAICTLYRGCTAELTNPNMYEVADVAMANNGDCWASAVDSLGTATLTYFAGCTGGGAAATGWANTYYGGLDIDANGNLVAVDAFTPALRVYSGCNPACTLVGGPFPLFDDCVFGHVNKQSMTFACGDYALGQIDVYYYSPTSLTYWYSFNNGFSVSDDVEAAAYNPRSRQ
jgi:hypothetical protein